MEEREEKRIFRSGLSAAELPFEAVYLRFRHTFEDAGFFELFFRRFGHVSQRPHLPPRHQAGRFSGFAFGPEVPHPERFDLVFDDGHLDVFDERGGIGREEKEQAERQYRTHHKSRTELNDRLPALRDSPPRRSALAPPSARVALGLFFSRESGGIPRVFPEGGAVCEFSQTVLGLFFPRHGGVGNGNPPNSLGFLSLLDMADVPARRAVDWTARILPGAEVGAKLRRRLRRPGQGNQALSGIFGAGLDRMG